LKNSQREAYNLLETGKDLLRNERFNESLMYFEKSRELFEKMNNVEEVANCLSDISLTYSRLGNFKIALDNLFRCLEIREKLNNEIQLGRTYNQLGNCFVNLGETDEAIKYYKKALELNESVQFLRGISISSVNLGNLYKDIGKLDEASRLYYKAHEIDLKTNDKEGLAVTYSSIGNLNAHTGDLYSALDYFFKAQNIQEELNQKQSIAITLNNIGNVYKSLNEFDLALENFEQAYNILISLEIKRGVSQILSNMGVCYAEKNEFEKALDYQKKALKYSREVGDKLATGYALIKIAELKINSGKEDPMKYFTEAIEINKEIKNQIGLANVYMSIGQLYISNKDYDKAEEYLKLSLDISKENKINAVIQDCYLKLSEVNASKEDYESSYYYLKLHNDIKDKFLKEEYNKHIADLKLKYEKEKREKELYKEIANQKNKLEVLYNELKIKNEILIENEKLLKEAKDKAEEMSNIKSIFLANMSHELRTPMNGILGLTELLKEITANNSEEFDIAETVHESAERLMTSINQILEFTELENDNYSAFYSDFDLILIVKETIKSVRKKADKKHLRINLITSKPKIEVNLDKSAIRKILKNILDNAVKFTKHGSIDIILYKDEGNLIIKIADTGIGIEEKQMNIIFDSFRQGSEGLVRNFEGMGLGLSIVKRLVDLLNGKIEIETVQNKGTTFILKFKV